MFYLPNIHEEKWDRSPNLFDSKVHALYTKGNPQIYHSIYKSFDQVGTSAKKKKGKKKTKTKETNHIVIQDFTSKNTDCRQFSFIIINTSLICISAKNKKRQNIICIVC